MLLLFRFLFTMIAGAFRPRIGPLDESRVTFTALPTDCDLNFHLNAGRFVSFMDVARIELIARMRLLVPLLRRGWRPVMGGCAVRFRRSVLPFERFTIRSRVIGWDDKWFYVEHIVERGGVFCARGVMRTVIRSKERTLEPREIIALTKYGDLVSPPLPAWDESV